MFERFTEPSRRAVIIARQEACRLGHHWVGTEHLLLGVAVQDDQLAALVLAQRGLTAPRIRSEIDRIIGNGPAETPMAPGIDAGALATLGIDLDAVRRRVEATFGPGALERNPRGRRCEPEQRQLPFTPRAKKALELTLLESVAQRHGEITTPDLVIGLLGADGTAAQILHEHGVNAAALRTPNHTRRPRRLFNRRSDRLAG
jgi:ATP-dependent Clp protease ATP-binding subunit ClpA